MILVIIRMKVLPENRKEFSQAITSLMVSIRAERGCHRCDFCQSMEDEDELYLYEEWETQKSLAGHLQSEQFKVLLGAMTLLRKTHEIRIYEDLSVSQRDHHDRETESILTQISYLQSEQFNNKMSFEMKQKKKWMKKEVYK